MNVGSKPMTNKGSTILVYSVSNTERLRYIVDVVFDSKAAITDSIEIFTQFDGLKINYSNQQINTEQTGVVQLEKTQLAQLKNTQTDSSKIGQQLIQIIPYGLLHQENIAVQSIECFEWEGLTAFFKTAENSLMPFDFFAASFYLISRYEEYLPYTKDDLNRFEHTNSLAYQQNFLHLPLIQLWCNKLFEKSGLQQHCLQPKFSFIPTYDIDIAYSYRYHTVARNVYGFFKDLFKLDHAAVIERLQVLESIQKDPYDIYEWLDLLHDSLHLKPIYFFLLAADRKGLDKNISPKHPSMLHLLQQHAAKYTVGIHPSIQSNSKSSLLNSEINNMASMIDQSITSSRNHYIQIQFPQSFERMIQSGITNDYSMGYPTINGFRASYSKSFNWFNLRTNSSTTLKMHPFCYMDSTAIFQERITPEKAVQDLQYYYDTVKSVGGECITIFHNNFLTNQVAFKEWRLIYADFLLHNCTQ
jgi:hypothetical protein